MANAPLDFPLQSLVGILMAQFNKLQADVTALHTALDEHTHTENADAAYTQDATTGAGPTLDALTSEQVSTI